MLVVLIVFVLVVLIQLVYFSITLFVFKRSQRSAAAGSPPPVSVVVCAHDEEENLRRLIPKLLSQKYEHFEVIIVNDRSNDGTYDLLLELTARHPNLRMVNVKDTPAHVNGKKFALTLGIRAATHEWLLLTDADCEPVSDLWIEKVASHCAADAKFILGFSPYLEAPGFLNLFIRFESMLTAIQYFSFSALKNPYMGVGRNLAYRKSLFLEKKGFNNFQHITGGDDDLFVNLHAQGANTRSVYVPESLVFSIPKKTVAEFFHQKVRHLSVGKLYRSGHKFLLAAVSLSWLLTFMTGWVLVIVSPYRFYVLGALVVRWILMMITFDVFTKRTGLRFKVWTIPALDFVYPIYYISTGLVALFTRKVRWKK